MRLRLSPPHRGGARWGRAVLTGVLLLALAAGAHATQTPNDAPTVSDEQVQAAVKVVRADPNWGLQTQEKRLRFKPPQDKPEDKPTAKPDDLAWLTEATRWLSQAGRVLVWALGALAVALLLVGARRWIRVRADATGPLLPDLPSHVSHLDIRPQSLPEQVGDAAAALWQRGEHRQALSLLYRGVLSRLVHQHSVPIVAASTEDECIALARARLDALRGAYVQRMVGAWQRAVYGAELPPTALMLELCQAFATHFAAPPPQGASA